ncbi:TonB-dependent receptor [Tenacibaculum sp. S7007]|uniref:TonB-dependent receptor n=1 Tax=Tenacibaculum pelagium TaxID=2759527 RepID=A0A839ARU9_9FLAO|nr:TonB-dependent receptor [Tenacibaculum pelagium]MBA6157080.1 TonB-dependent receptor [Tenacibaculum pelagium]
MKKILFITLICLCNIVFAQDKGTVTGTLTDKEMNGEALPFANVFIKGTTIGGTTDMDGKYTLNVPVGNQTIVFSFIGYQTIEKTIEVKANQTLTINQELGANEGVTLDEVQIKATVSKEKESALLLEQKKAVSIKTTIGAQELSKKGVSDVATAVTKATGISKQEGSNNVYVRGLGDRYNSTTLNGLPLPSNNPSKKNINLDIFSTGIVKLIDINKIYNNQIYGDFGGANINIASKEHTGKPYLEIGLGSGVNSRAAGQDHFYLQDGPGFWGFDNPTYPNNPLTNYNFTTSWDKTTKSPFNTNFSLKGGKKFNIGEESSLSVFGTLAFGNDFKYKNGISRSVNGNAILFTDYNYDSFDYNTNTTGMLNVLYKINSKHKLRYNTLYINSSNQSLDDYNGVINTFDNASEGGGLVRRSTFDRTTLLVNQLLGNHKIKDDYLNGEWGIAFNKLDNIVPDRRQNMLVPQDNDNINGPKIVSDLASSDNHRYYQNLDEKEYAFNGSVNYLFNKNEDEVYNGKITLGYSGKWKDVNFDATQFNFKINRNITQPIIDVNDLDAYFSQNGLNNNYFDIVTFRGNASISNALTPQFYKGRQIISGVFGNIEYKFGEKLTANLGVKYEQIYQKVEWETALQPLGGENYFFKKELLPNLALKYAVNDKNNIKFAASKTYTLPQFKERAPFQFEDVNQTKFGNPYLDLSTNYNFDLRWEMFPKSGEVISLTGFGKIIKNPINEIIVASATNDISYANTGNQAEVFGAEFEIRKEIFNHVRETETEDFDNKLTVGFNTSYMYNNQDINREKVFNDTKGFLNIFPTNTESKLTGASDLLVNADVSYLKEFNKNQNLLMTLAYNYFSDRVYAIGVASKGNLVDQGVSTLDFIAKSKLSDRINVGLSLKNLLNPTVTRTQEIQNVDVLSFKKGVNFGLSFSYKID